MTFDEHLEMEMELQDRERQDRISRMQLHGSSRTHCAECGEEIPLARQRALPGVRTCVDCQGIQELMGVRHG